MLAIKRLQSQGLPLRAIRGLVQGHPEADLEALLGAGGEGAAASAASVPESDPAAYLRRVLLRQARHQEPHRAAAAPLPPPPAAAPLPAYPSARASRAAAGAPATATWRRVLVEEGLELHAGEDFAPPASPEGRRQLVERLAAAVDHLAPKGRKHR